MAASYVMLRGLMGGLCSFFSYYLGRSLSARKDGRATNSQVMRWGLRVAVTALGTAWGALDRLTLLLLALAALSAAYGYYAGQRPRPPEEDLSKQMFPGE
jgi:hypothetical protein